MLQSIFNKEARLVVPIAMRTPQLLRTDMDQVRLLCTRRKALLFAFTIKRRK